MLGAPYYLGLNIRLALKLFPRLIYGTGRAIECASGRPRETVFPFINSKCTGDEKSCRLYVGLKVCLTRYNVVSPMRGPAILIPSIMLRSSIIRSLIGIRNS